VSKKILLVDDSAVLRKIVSFNLKKEGYEVIEAVLKKLQEKEEWKRIPVIVLTAKGGEEDESLALSLGARKVMRKPFSPSQFIEEVKHLLNE